MRYALLALAGAVLALTSASFAARGANKPEISYTAEQAWQGRLAYYEHCAECHGGGLGGVYGPALAGPDSELQWETGQYVFGYITGFMPHGDPGSLPLPQYLAIMAFIYQQHHHPAGSKPLAEKAAKADTGTLGL